MEMKNYVTEKKKVRSVTWMPGWLLGVIGFIDSEFGEEVCSAHLEKLHIRMARFAAEEDRLTENRLTALRTEAQEIIEKIRMNLDFLEKLPDMKSGDSVEIARENIKIHNEKKLLEEKIFTDRCQLKKLPEIMMHVELDRNIYVNNALRLNRDEKMKAYVKGVRRGKLPQYKVPEMLYDDSARDLFRKEHEALEAEIYLVLAMMEG